MSGHLASLAAGEGARKARSALVDFLSRELSTEVWRMAGRFEAEPLGGGLYLAKIDPDDPLRLEHLPSGQKLVVPYREMETDFASVPRIIQRLTRDSSLVHLQSTSYRGPALMHDEFYTAAWAWVVKAGRRVRVPVSKRQADACLFIGLECKGASVADGLAYHGGVALFGGPAWRQCRRDQAKWPEMFGKEKC